MRSANAKKIEHKEFRTLQISMMELFAKNN